MRSASSHRLKRSAVWGGDTAGSATTTSCSSLARESPASTPGQLDVGDVHHGQLLAHVGYRTGDFHVTAHVLAESVLVGLEGVDIIGILFVIQDVRRAVLGQERHLFPPYHPRAVASCTVMTCSQLLITCQGFGAVRGSAPRRGTPHSSAPWPRGRDRGCSGSRLSRPPSSCGARRAPGAPPGGPHPL